MDMDMAISLIDAYAYAYGALMAVMAATRSRWPRGWRGVQKTAGGQSPCDDTWHYMRMVIV